MTPELNNVPESWIVWLGGRDASGWLEAFVRSPKKAVSDLLWDVFYFGPLNLTDRSQLLKGWLDHFGDQESFAQRLDVRFANWVEEHWGHFDGTSEELASAWSCICGVVEFSSKLPEESRLKSCASHLRGRFEEHQQFLGSFSTAPTSDPLGAYLAVVAEFQGDDRSLAPFWHRMCDLPDGVPFYHATYAMHGLRRLKAADESEDGTLRAEVVLGLLRLARAFDRLVRERALQDHIAKNWFCRVAADTAAAYPSSPRWREHGLADMLELPERPRKWLREAVPPLAEAERRAKEGTTQYQYHRRSIEPDRDWSRRAGELADRLARGDHNTLPEVKRLLEEQARYTEATGDSYFLVRSLLNFASQVLRFQPNLSLSWAEAARRWEPRYDFAWNTVRTVLLYQGRLKEALRIAWIAWKRFPEDVVTHNGLAEALKADKRYDEAEAVYRQTIERFPKDLFARNGLASVLMRAKRYDEAEQVYREIIRIFPDDTVALNGLADMLRRVHRWNDAEEQYRRCIRLGHVDSFTFVGLAQLALRKGDAGRAEAIDLLDEALKLDPRDKYVRKIKRSLTTTNDVDIDDLMSEWDSVVDASLETEILMPQREEQLSPELHMVTQRNAELLRAEPKVTLDVEVSRTETSGVSSEADTEFRTVTVDEHVWTEAETMPDPEPSTTHTSGGLSAPDNKFQTVTQVDKEDVRAKEGAMLDLEPSTTHTGEELSATHTEFRAATQIDKEDVGAEAELMRDLELSTSQENEELASADAKLMPISDEPEGIVNVRASAADGGYYVIHPGKLRLEGPASLQVAALLAEAYFYRTWAKGADEKSAKARRRKAVQLISQAANLAAHDPQVLAEQVALAVEGGDEATAYEKLMADLNSRDAAVPLLVLKARLDRERAQGANLRLSDLTLAKLYDAPEQLQKLERPPLTTLSHFQKGLASLALLDGTRRLETAAQSFNSFRRLLANRASEEKQERERDRNIHARDVPRFHEWLQMQTDSRFFNAVPESEVVSATDIPAIESALMQYAAEAIEVEDLFADRVVFSAT